MTSSSIHANPLGGHHRHAAVKTPAQHLKPKHPEPRHLNPVARKKPVGGAVLAAGVAVAVIVTVAMWAPMLGASRSTALDSETAADQGSASTVQLPAPTLVPDTGGDGLTAGSAELAATAAQVTAARSFAGSQLADNPGLTLSATARELLIAGQVDARGILSLGQYLGQTQLTVADFPATDAGSGADRVRRGILVSSRAGVPLGTGASASDSAAAAVQAWFQSLGAPVNVQSVVRTAAGVLVTFAPGEPSSLLPTPAPSL